MLCATATMRDPCPVNRAEGQFRGQRLAPAKTESNHLAVEERSVTSLPVSVRAAATVW